jgi:hypothetical protein
VPLRRRVIHDHRSAVEPIPLVIPAVKVNERYPHVLTENAFSKERSLRVDDQVRWLIEVLIQGRVDVCLGRLTVLNNRGFARPVSEGWSANAAKLNIEQGLFDPATIISGRADLSATTSDDFDDLLC